MKKTLLLSTAIFFLYGLAIAQAKEGTVALQQTVPQQVAALIDLPYSPIITERAFNDYLSKTGKKAQKEAQNYLLSENTPLAKNNVTAADLHFFIGRGEEQNKYGSVVYLRLSSVIPNPYNTYGKTMYFNMQEAKDYLNNLAVAIKPYAVKLQQKDLVAAQAKQKSLTEEANQLEMERKSINLQISENRNDNKADGLARAKAKNERKINNNLSALDLLNDNIVQQLAALSPMKQ